MLVFIYYTAMFGIPTYKEFDSVEYAVTWCRMIGQPELIKRITTISGS